MRVTGNPVIILGIVTAPPGPVYPVMVIVPLLVVNVNWACTTVGKASSSNQQTKKRWRYRCWQSFLETTIIGMGPEADASGLCGECILFAYIKTPDGLWRTLLAE